MDNPPDDGPCEVTITAPDRGWLQAFGRQLVEDGLAAAAHVDIMQTTYRWADEVHESDEARAVLHTQFRRVSAIVEKVERSHPYEVACVSVVAISGGAGPYLEWVRDETK